MIGQARVKPYRRVSDVVVRSTAGLPEGVDLYNSRAEWASFLSGTGIEVGAGVEPVRLPAGVHCYYGDIRDKEELKKYFRAEEVAPSLDGNLDAQTFSGVPSHSQDFVISCHVIEHLWDPIGAVEQALRVLKHGGHLLLCVPDRRHTFDCLRPATSIEHLIEDYASGGESTRRQAYEEHARYVHTYLTGEQLNEEQIRASVEGCLASNMDCHVHCWDTQECMTFLQVCSQKFGAEVVSAEGVFINENRILKKTGTIFQRLRSALQF